jgi:hypothetical protein
MTQVGRRFLENFGEAAMLVSRKQHLEISAPAPDSSQRAPYRSPQGATGLQPPSDFGYCGQARWSMTDRKSALCQKRASSRII